MYQGIKCTPGLKILRVNSVPPSFWPNRSTRLPHSAPQDSKTGHRRRPLRCRLLQGPFLQATCWKRSARSLQDTWEQTMPGLACWILFVCPYKICNDLQIWKLTQVNKAFEIMSRALHKDLGLLAQARGSWFLPLNRLGWDGLDGKISIYFHHDVPSKEQGKAARAGQRMFFVQSLKGFEIVDVIGFWEFCLCLKRPSAYYALLESWAWRMSPRLMMIQLSKLLCAQRVGCGRNVMRIMLWSRICRKCTNGKATNDLLVCRTLSW